MLAWLLLSGGLRVERRLRHPYWKLNHEPARGLVVLLRTPIPFHALADLEASVNEVAAVLDTAGRDGWRLLVDLREGPMRTDPAFENAMADLRPKLLGGLAKIAVLVASPLGAMQVSRHQRQGPIAWATFNDEAAAFQYLNVRPSTTSE